MTQARIETRIVSTDGFRGAVHELTTADIHNRLRTHRMPEHIRVALEAEIQVRRDRANQEFREEVVEALKDEGKAPHVAMNLTDTETKLLAQAKRLGLI